MSDQPARLQRTTRRDDPVADQQVRDQRRALRGKVDGIGAVLAGGANVVLQLSWPEVGRGVLESPVTSGSVRHHPIKRTRTTLTYISVAMYGDAETRAAYREAVNGSHRQVRSAPGAKVRYNAFDRHLQLWVASCLYYGARDMAIRMHGELDEESERLLLEVGKRFGTTLQVPEEMWPADREAFYAYWWEAMREIEMDDVTRGYLRDLTNITFMHPRIRRVLARNNRMLTVGFLPEQFRELLQEPWTLHDQKRFEKFLRRALALDRRLPAWLRHSLLNVYEWDVKRRIRLGRPIV